MSNHPCVGCWYNEGEKCFQDKLADVHGLDKAPRNGLSKDNPSGLDITDELLDTCIARELSYRKEKVVRAMLKMFKTQINAPQQKDAS